MDILVIVFVLIIFVGIKPTKYNSDFLGRDTTTAIKGIFAIIILFSHTRQYLSPMLPISISTNGYNFFFNKALDFLGQLMVVMFLLYSGYGIVESYKKKKQAYTKGFLKKRVLKTLIHFDLAVLLFVLVALLLGHKYSYEEYILSFTGWLSVGNSNWFVFDIIILYLLSFGGLLIVEEFHYDLKKYLWIVCFLTFIFALVLYKLKATYWWDTLLAYPTGMLWSVYKEELIKFFSEKKRYYSVLAIMFIIFLVLYKVGNLVSSGLALFTSAIFGIIIVMITIKFRIGNQVLYWLGINAFSIYILQRIPMIIFSEYGFNENHLLFASIVFPLVLILAWTFTKLTNLIDRKFFK
ncbi:MAG: hypothetical protein K2G85_03275 [Muribaculaceae bacterium]|nr:hypothetical protein [Muribaculaceae bacterium]